MSLIQPIIKEINSNITNLEGLSYNDNDLNLKKLQEFYSSVKDAYIKYINLGEGEKSDPKKDFKTFLDYLRSYLFNFKNTRFKINSKTNVVILSKRYYEKDGFTLSFCAKTFKTLDFRHFARIDETQKQGEDIYKNVISIETLKEGTNMIVVIKDGKIIGVRTSGTYNAESSYDTTETHYELFFKLLDETGFGLSKFFEISKTKPNVRFCFNFLMKLNFTPFPTFSKNEIHLMSAYEINDKENEFELFNKQLLELPKDNFEEKQQELEEFINTELTTSYINYFDIYSVISLFNNIGSGLIKGPELYGITPDMDIKSTIEQIIQIQDTLQGKKGIIIKYSDGKYYDIINSKYEYLIVLRCGSSMEVRPENERSLFYNLFLKLRFKSDDKEEKERAFQDFYTHYDSEDRMDGKGGQYRELFRKFEIAILEYAKKAFNLYKINRMETTDFYKRIEQDEKIPICLKYKNRNCIYMIHDHYQLERKKEDAINPYSRLKFTISLPDVYENIILKKILKSKYEIFMRNDPKEKFKDIWGDIYGKIMTPK